MATLLVSPVVGFAALAHALAEAPGAVAANAAELRFAGSLRLGLLGAARDIELGMSRAEVVELLERRGFSLEIEADLPPDGRTRLLLAVPAEDDCLPRGAPFMCPNLRVNFLNDPQRGLRVVRIEAFQTIEAEFTVADVFRHIGAAMGPPLQTLARAEQVRGGSVGVWRQRWQEGPGDGPLLEILATQDNTDPSPVGITDPHRRALGVGYVRAAADAEGSFASVRRRLLDRRDGG